MSKLNSHEYCYVPLKIKLNTRYFYMHLNDQIFFFSYDSILHVDKVKMVPIIAMYH